MFGDAAERRGSMRIRFGHRELEIWLRPSRLEKEDANWPQSVAAAFWTRNGLVVAHHCSGKGKAERQFGSSGLIGWAPAARTCAIKVVICPSAAAWFDLDSGGADLLRRSCVWASFNGGSSMLAVVLALRTSKHIDDEDGIHMAAVLTARMPYIQAGKRCHRELATLSTGDARKVTAGDGYETSKMIWGKPQHWRRNLQYQAVADSQLSHLEASVMLLLVLFLPI
jgi:hypothetical protein